MRRIDYIVVHCSATPANMDIGAAEIDKWHRERGFSKIGYHYVIRRNGTVEKGRDVSEVGAHVAGHNTNSIGVCLVGGVDANNKSKADFNYTYAQMEALDVLLGDLLGGILDPKYSPNVKIVGHRDLDPGKACPCFDVRRWRYGDMAAKTPTV